MFEYTVKSFPKIYDGDTVTAEVDLGFGISFTQTFRLLGIDTPELRGEEREAGLVSRDRLREILFGALDQNKTVTIKTYKDRKGKYGRYLAVIFVEGFEKSINEVLLDEGLAEVY